MRVNFFMKLCSDGRKISDIIFSEKYFLEGIIYLGHTLANKRRKPACSTKENSCESSAIISAIQFTLWMIVSPYFFVFLHFSQRELTYTRLSLLRILFCSILLTSLCFFNSQFIKLSRVFLLQMILLLVL